MGRIKENEHCIVVEQIENDLRVKIYQYESVKSETPHVIMVPLPLMSRDFPDRVLNKFAGIPVSISPILPKQKVLVTDTQVFCSIKQLEKEEGYFNVH